MSKRKKKMTRKQKREMNPHGSGNSKYAKKIQARRKLALSMGLPGNTPYPVLWASR